MLASTHLANEARLGGDVVAGYIAAVAGALRAVDRFAVELGEQDVRDGMEHGFRGAFEQIGEADVEFSLAQPDGVVDGYEWVEPNVQGRQRRAGAKLAIAATKDFGEPRGHGEGRVAWGRSPQSVVSCQRAGAGFPDSLRSSPINYFSVNDGEFFSEGSSDQSAEAAEEESTSASGHGSVVCAGAERGPDARADAGSGHGVGGLAMLKAHLAHSVTFVNCFGWNGRDDHASTSMDSAFTNELLVGCAQEEAGVADEGMVRADGNPGAGLKVLDRLPVSGLRWCGGREQHCRGQEEDGFCVSHDLILAIGNGPGL